MSGLVSANQSRTWSCGEARLACTGILPVSSFPVVTARLYRCTKVYVSMHLNVYGYGQKAKTLPKQTGGSRHVFVLLCHG